ncbi:hypothetical protein ACOMHN_024619 [Nucella lapillus]
MSLMSAFHGRNQLPGQSVLEYAQALKSLEDQANSRKESSVTPEMLRDRFIEGLASTPLKRELRRLVREQGGATFFTIKDEAIRWIREEDDPSEAPPVVFRQHLATPGPPAPPEATQLERKLAVLTDSVQAMQAFVKALTDGLAATRSSVQITPQQRRGPLTNTGRCFYCQKQGHLRRDCLKRKRDEARNAGTSQAEN